MFLSFGWRVWHFFLSFCLRERHQAAVLINHERIHLRQQLEMGLILFYIWYFAEYLIRLVQYKKHYLAYLHISFEREAYQNEADLDYLKKRTFWAF